MEFNSDATFLGLPSELRLLIYSFIGTFDGRQDFEVRPDFVSATRPSDCTQTLASLSGTCTKIHEEIADSLYQNLQAKIEVTNRTPYRRDHRRERLLSPGLTYFRSLRSVDIHCSINTGQSIDIQRRTIEWFEDVLTVLSMSDELEHFRFDAQLIIPGPNLRKHRFGKEIEKLQSASDGRSVPNGRSPKDVTLDCAWRAVPLLKRAVNDSLSMED